MSDISMFTDVDMATHADNKALMSEFENAIKKN